MSKKGSKQGGHTLHQPQLFSFEEKDRLEFLACNSLKGRVKKDGGLVLITSLTIHGQRAALSLLGVKLSHVGNCVGAALTHFTTDFLLPLHGPVSLVGVQFVLCCHFRSKTGCSLSGNQILLTSMIKKFALIYPSLHFITSPIRQIKRRSEEVLSSWKVIISILS